MSLLHRDGHATPKWLTGVIRVLGTGGSVGDTPVLRSLGQFVLLAPHNARGPSGPGRHDRDDLLSQWTRSGHLTADDAEWLLALDESTRWYDRTC